MSTPWYDDPITHGYITGYEGPGTDTPHYAYDLGTPFHTPLTAPESGTVVTADYQAWGGEIFIKPDNGSMEYYMYHPDVVEVQKGEHVNAGQEIALSGGENPGYPGAEHPASQQWSTGPHTHIGYFENWTKTPIGTLPYGPSPAGLIAAAKGAPYSPPSGSSVPSGATGVKGPTKQGMTEIGVGMVGVAMIAVGVIVFVLPFVQDIEGKATKSLVKKVL